MPTHNLDGHAPYIGRFAPSPSGPLHFGSLVTALGSYLRAKQRHGQWLVRVEDIDPPREIRGATWDILTCLEAHGLLWDGAISYQSQHTERYLDCLNNLANLDLSYACECTRKRIKSCGGVYDGFCRHKQLAPVGRAIRLANQVGRAQFEDQLLGSIRTPAQFAEEDFILKRRDGLFAYQLAVVIDDHDQGITEVVRGQDLLEVTVRQLSLFQTFGWRAPDYLHLPLAITPNGNKLSKQNHAPGIINLDASNNLVQALIFLGQSPADEWRYETPEQILQLAQQDFQLEAIPKQAIVWPLS